jgi:hypothetical protein
MLRQLDPGRSPATLSAYRLGVLKQTCCRIVRHATRLKIPDHTGHRPVLGHRHQRGQGDTLSCTLGDEARAQAVPAKAPFQTGLRRAPLHDRADRRRRQCVADPRCPGQGADQGDRFMPRGITQEQVNAAADALVAAGDKPTVEKVRAAMGTGSPNTVTRMLDTWRCGLAERLQNVLQLPELPPEAGQAMTGLWQLAVKHADHLLQARMATERAALAANEARLTEERTQWAATLAEAETAVAHARMRQELAEHACANLDNQLRDSHALRDDLIQQRDRLQALCDRKTGELEALQADRIARLAAAEHGRERTAAHVQGVEDRAHQEIDSARQEAKQCQQRHEVAERSYREALHALESRCEATRRRNNGNRPRRTWRASRGKSRHLKCRWRRPAPSEKRRALPERHGRRRSSGDGSQPLIRCPCNFA